MGVRKKFFVFLVITFSWGFFWLPPQNHILVFSQPLQNNTDFFWQFNSSNPFTMPIPPNAAYEEESDKYMEFFATNQAGEFGFTIAVKGWTYPIYFADQNTPRYDVKLTAGYTEDDVLENVPIPDHAKPDPLDDGHLVIIDNVSRIEYDFWQAKKLTNGQWQASWGNYISLESDGIYPYGLSARGSGFAATQGLVWPQEIQVGKIEHALFFSIDPEMVKDGGPIRPATESDGESKEPYALPEGARLQLDPSIDVSALGLTPAEEIIAKALQKYGMILGDVGGGIGLYAANVDGYDWGNTFGPLDPLEGYAFLFSNKISIKSFKVLKMGCQFQTISPGQKLPKYRLYLEGEEVIDDCSGLGEDAGGEEEIPSFTFFTSFAAISLITVFVTAEHRKKKQKDRRHG